METRILVAPTGWGKTRSIIRSLSKRRGSCIAFLPTHDSMKTASHYIPHTTTKRCIYVRGRQHSCIFSDPPQSLVSWIRDGLNGYVDSLWREMERELGERRGMLREFYRDLLRAKSEEARLGVMRRWGMKNVCQLFCPVYRLMSRHRDAVHRAIERHRRIADDEDVANMWGGIHGNPRREKPDVGAGEYVICPHALILGDFSLNRNDRPVSTLYRSIVLAPHRLYTYVSSALRRLEEVTPSVPATIFIDEYDRFVVEHVDSHPVIPSSLISRVGHELDDMLYDVDSPATVRFLNRFIRIYRLLTPLLRVYTYEYAESVGWEMVRMKTPLTTVETLETLWRGIRMADRKIGVATVSRGLGTLETDVVQLVGDAMERAPQRIHGSEYVETLLDTIYTVLRHPTSTWRYVVGEDGRVMTQNVDTMLDILFGRRHILASATPLKAEYVAVSVGGWLRRARHDRYRVGDIHVESMGLELELEGTRKNIVYDAPLTSRLWGVYSRIYYHSAYGFLQGESDLVPYLESIPDEPTVLVVTQNKTVARLLRMYLRRVLLTYFRSRLGRGIDIDRAVDRVYVVGSPYPRPRILSRRPPISMYETMNHAVVKTLRGGEVYLRTGVEDVNLGINELIQIVGRVMRQGVRQGRIVEIHLPTFLEKKIEIYAPDWFLNIPSEHVD